MTIEPTQLEVRVNERDSVTALLYAAPKNTRAGVTLILGHGAGSNQLSSFMQHFAKGLAARGLDVLTFNFVYMEQGRKVPDQNAKLEFCYRAVIDAALKHKKLKDNHLAIGGKSMGGRIASQVASVDHSNIAGLVYLGYPLHPPGNLEKLRDKHLSDITAPQLFVQGSRDAFGTAEELRSVTKRLKLATLHVIEGGDHSLKVPKSSGIPQAQVYELTMDAIARWLRSELS